MPCPFLSSFFLSLCQSDCRKCLRLQVRIWYLKLRPLQLCPYVQTPWGSNVCCFSSLSLPRPVDHKIQCCCSKIQLGHLEKCNNVVFQLIISFHRLDLKSPFNLSFMMQSSIYYLWTLIIFHVVLAPCLLAITVALFSCGISTTLNWKPRGEKVF